MYDIGLKRGTVRLVRHNLKWKNIFEEEKKLLLEKFPDTILKISHGGSTAIPTISAKPIIDMFAVVPSLRDADAMQNDLEKLGYEYLGEDGVPERRLAVKGDPEKRTHHLQLVEESSKQWTNHILIREYYLKHLDVAEEYEKLKQGLAQKFPEDKNSYTKGKEPFIQSVIEKAMLEKQNTMTETAYGFIPFHRDEQGLKVFLIHQYGSGGDTLWTFPKGRGEEGETPIQTALREVKEETGLEIASYDESKTVSTSYTFERCGEQVEKTSTYFIGFVKDPNFKIQEAEVKEAGWLTPEQARERITFPDYKVLLDEALVHIMSLTTML